MSVVQTKQPNIENNKNRYYNQGRNDGDEEEEDEMNMYADQFQNSQDIQNDQGELDEQDLHQQLPMIDQNINQLQNNNHEYDQEQDNEQYQFNQFHQLQHVFKQDQEIHGGLEKQWFYSFQENSEDNENVQQISQIPSSQFQSQQQSIQSSQQKLPSYINPQQQFQQKQGYSQNQQLQTKNQQFQFISSKQPQQNIISSSSSIIQGGNLGQSQQGNYDDKDEEEDSQDQFKQIELMQMMQGNSNNQKFAMNQIAKKDQQRQNNSQRDQQNIQGDVDLRQSQQEQLEQLAQDQQQDQQQPIQNLQEDMIMCNKCQNFPFNYIELNCQHSFCLKCMAEWFIQQDYLTIDQIFELPISSTDENYSELKEECMINVQCMHCVEQTLLDYDSVEAVKEVIRQIQINQQQIYENGYDDQEQKPIKDGDDNYFQNQQDYQGQQQYAQEDQFHLKGFTNKQNKADILIANSSNYNSCDDNEEQIDESQLNYQNQIINNKNQSLKSSPLVNMNEYQKQLSESSSQSSSQGFSINQPSVFGSINLQKVQPVIQPNQQSPVLVIQNDSQINSLQARQEIIYEDSSETFQTEETNRNHNVNNQINISKEDINLNKKQQDGAQQPNTLTADSKSSSVQQDYQNQNYMKEEQKRSHGKEFNKFINTSNKNYHYVNSQQSFSNNNSPNNNTTPYDTNSMQIFSKKNQDYTSFSNSQFNASMTPQSNTDINFANKEQQQIIKNHAMPFNEYFSASDKQNNLISPSNIQQIQQQQQQQYSQQNVSLQNQQGELTQSNYSGASTSHNHESSTMSEAQRKMISKGNFNEQKQTTDTSKKMQVKSTPLQFQSSERNTDVHQLEDVQEHYGEQTDDETEGSAFKYPQKLNFSKNQQQKNMENVPNQIEHPILQTENVKKELNYDDFANVSDSNLQEEESFQHQQVNAISNNPSLRESQKSQQEKGNKLSQQLEQDRKYKQQNDNQNFGTASFNQFAQQIQKIQQKDQIKNIQIPNQTKPQGFDQKFISRDLKNQQQQQQEEQYMREQFQQENDNGDDIPYDLRANEEENQQYIDNQETFSNQLYNQIKIEQKQNLEQKIQKLSNEQFQKQQTQTSKQYNNQQITLNIDDDLSQQLPQQQKNSVEKFDKNTNSVRPLQNVNQYEPPEDSSNKKKSNTQKFIIQNNNQSNFSTNTNFTSNYNNNLTNQINTGGSNFLTAQQNLDNLNSNNLQSTVESQKYKLPQNTNYQQSFNSSLNEDRLNPMQSVQTVERSIDNNLQKNGKRNSQRQNNPDDESSFQKNQESQNSQFEKQAKIIQKQQIESINRKNSTEMRGNQSNNFASINSKSSGQNNNLSMQIKKTTSQTQNDQMSLEISNSMNEMSSQAEYFEKKQGKQDIYYSGDSQQIQGYNKYDLPLKQQQNIAQNEYDSVNNNLSQISNQKRDPSPQIAQQKQAQSKNTSQSNNNNQRNQIQSQQENEESLKRSFQNKIVDNKQKFLQQQQQQQQDIQEISNEQEMYQQNDFANEEECENIQFKLQPYCDEHPYEELGFFNFSQNKCICLKCLQKGEFVTEDVTNFEKGQELLLEKVDDCSRQINVCFELIKLSQKREEEKHRKRIEKSNQAKILINEQISLLIQKLEEKQSQLTVEAEEVQKISENILNTKQEELQHKFKILSQLRFHFSEINARNIQPNAKTYKEFQFCRNILDQFLFENEDILQLASNANNSPNASASKNQMTNLNNQYFLQQSQQDIIINNFKMDEISNFIDQIQFLKNKISDLRGVELGTHNSSLRNSFANNANSKAQQQVLNNNNNLNPNNTSSKMITQSMQPPTVSQVHSFLNEDAPIQNNNQPIYKEPKPYYKSSDKSTRRQSSSQKQQIQQQQQQQQSYQQQEQSGNNFSPNQLMPQIADSYQMNPPNAFEPEEQTINLNQLFQQQILQQQQMQQMQQQINNQAPVNPIKKSFNDQIQYVIGSNPFDKEKHKDTNSTFSSQNLTYINNNNNNNNSLNFANPLSQKLYQQFLTNVNSPANQQQVLTSQSFSNQNLIKSQSQKNLYEQQQHYPNQLLQEFQQKSNPFSPNIASSNYPTLSNNNDFKERKQQKTDPGNIAATHSGPFRQYQNNSTKANQQHLMQFNQILNNHLGSGTLNNNGSSSNLMMMNTHGISLLDGGISHHLGSTTEASKNIQLIDDQFTSFKNNLAEEFNNSIENHNLKRPSFPTTSANKSGQQTIDIFRKTNSVSNIISQNTHQSPSRYALLKGVPSNNKIASTVNSTLPKSSEYYNKSSFISNYYNTKLDKGSFTNANANSNNNSGVGIKTGNFQNSYSHRIQSTDPISAITSVNNNSIIAKKRQSQILRSHFTNNQNTSQGNINNYSSELKNSFCETGSINNSGNRYTTKKSEIGYTNNSNTLSNNYPMQIFNVPHNSSFSKSKQASHGNLHSFYNNNNNNVSINNNLNSNNNINTLHSEFNQNISFQGTSGKVYNIKNQNTIDSKNSGVIYKSLKKYQDLFRRQKKIMFDNENN